MIFSVIADFLTYNTIFVLLFSIDNRKKYFVSNNIDNNKQKLGKDILKIVTSLGIAELGYLLTKSLLIYSLFALTSLDSSQVSISSSVIATIVYIIIANILVKKLHLF